MSPGPGKSPAASGRIWDDPRWRAFVRGMAIGALVGAAMAGWSMWRRDRNGG